VKETNGNVRADSQVRDIPKAKISKCKNIQLQKNNMFMKIQTTTASFRPNFDKALISSQI
jgi:hypothetical protein